MHPRIDHPEKATAKYGNVAINALIKMMQDAGCKLKDLQAHILGGGYFEDAPPQNNIGEANVSIARKMLTRRGIRIVSEDTGGTMGRKVIFDIGTGQLAVFKVQKIREEDWHKDF